MTTTESEIFFCPCCGEAIDCLDYEERGVYELRADGMFDSYSGEVTDSCVTCPECGALLDVELTGSLCAVAGVMKEGGPRFARRSKQGHVVIERNYDRAILLRENNEYEPYVVAWGYDEDTGEWSQGDYYPTLVCAVLGAIQEG